MSKIRITASQHIYYSVDKALTDEELADLKNKVDEATDSGTPLEPEDLRINTRRDIYDADEIDPYDVSINHYDPETDSWTSIWV